MKYQISGITHTGKIRSINQDNYYCAGRYRALEDEHTGFDETVQEESKWIAAVFDGMGGEKDGEIASLLAGKMTYDRCGESDEPVDIGHLIEDLNKAVCEEMNDRRSHMGSTCVFLEFDGDKCRSWNIGDSRAYFFHDGELIQMTQDHTEAASLSSILGVGSAVKHGSENRLTQHLGIPEDDFIIEPFTSDWVAVSEGDTFLICSDGLTHMISDDMIAGVLGNDELPLGDKKIQLLDLALDKGGQDNTTIILIQSC